MSDIIITISGSRNYQNLSQVDEFVKRLPEGTIVLVGGAVGVDKAAEKAAHKYHLPVVVIPAEWEVYGNRAGSIRNGWMIERSNAFAAFWDGQSPGTRDAIRRARAATHIARMTVFRYPATLVPEQIVTTKWFHNGDK